MAMIMLRSREPGPGQVAQSLKDLASRQHGVWSHQEAFAVNAFVAWVNDIERTLRTYLVDPNLHDLFTSRYWQISSGGVSIPRLDEAIRAEADWQSDRLIDIANQLEAFHSRFGAGTETTFVVVDTNVFLHCKSLDEIDWSFVTNSPIRIVVPLRVIEELDAKRRDRNAEVMVQARASVRWLRDRLVGTDSRFALADGVTLEALVPTGSRVCEATADTEILEACETLWSMSKGTVVIVTQDLGMQLRGAHYRPDGSGFPVFEVPVAFQRP